MARRICDVRMQMGGGRGGFRAKVVREFRVARLQVPDPCRATTALRLGYDGAGRPRVGLVPRPTPGWGTQRHGRWDVIVGRASGPAGELKSPEAPAGLKRALRS